MLISSPMLDKADSGLLIDTTSTEELSNEITPTDYNYLRRMLKKCIGFNESDDRCWAYVQMHGTQAKIGINKYKGKCWFNVEGNPISFLTGQNMMGSLEIQSMTTAFYDLVLKAIKAANPSFKVPKSILEAVATLNLSIHRLAFACYTPSLQFRNWSMVERLIHIVGEMYSVSLMYKNESYTIPKILGIKVAIDGPMSLRFDAMRNEKRYYSLSLYNKWKEAIDKGKECVPELRDLLRFDLTLHSKWFNYNKIRTLGDVVNRFGSNYSGWVRSLFTQALDEIRLHNIFEYPNPTEVRVGNYADWYAAWLRDECVHEIPVGNRKDPNRLRYEWFKHQGIDVTLPHVFYLVAAKARAGINISGEHIAAIQDGSLAARRDVARLYIKGVENPDFQRVASKVRRIMPDNNFPSYRLLRDKLMDVETGEIVNVVKATL